MDIRARARGLRYFRRVCRLGLAELDYDAAADEETGRLVDFIQHRVQVKVNYCSVRQECEVSCFPSSSCGQKVSGPTKRVASESRPNPRGQDGTDRVR